MEYAEVLAIRELLTRPLRETFEGGEMTRGHDDDSVTFLEVGDVATDAFDDAGTLKRGSSIAGLDLPCVGKDVLYADTRISEWPTKMEVENRKTVR